MENPRFPWSTPHIHRPNCTQIGWSRPSRRRSASITSCGTAPPSPRNITSVMSPGIKRSMRNTSTATPSSVGTISAARWKMKRSTGCVRRRLLNPDGREILVEVVARGDVPAFHLGVKDDDPMPPDGGDDIGLLERVALELPQSRDAFGAVQLTRLFVEQLVQLSIDVAGVVDRRAVGGDVLDQLQIRLVHEVAVEVERGVVGRVLPLLRRQVQLGLELFVLRGH